MNNNKINHLKDKNKKSEYIVIDFTYNELINNSNEKNTLEIYKIFIGLIIYNVIIILFQIIKLKTVFKPIYLVPFLITLGFKIYDAFIYSSDVYSSSRLKLSYLIAFLCSIFVCFSACKSGCLCKTRTFCFYDCKICRLQVWIYVKSVYF